MMEPGDTESPHSSPGEWLAAAREQAGWSLVQTAERLHIDVAMVKALEAGRFEELGAAVYARGHLRRYAELLGLPAHEIEQAYAQAYRGAPLPDLTRTVGSLKNATAAGGVLRPWIAAVGAAILVVVGLVSWAMHVPRAQPAKAAHAKAPEVAGTPTPPVPATAAVPASGQAAVLAPLEPSHLNGTAAPSMLLGSPQSLLETHPPQPSASPGAATPARNGARRP